MGKDIDSPLSSGPPGAGFGAVPDHQLIISGHKLPCLLILCAVEMSPLFMSGRHEVGEALGGQESEGSIGSVAMT